MDGAEADAGFLLCVFMCIAADAMNERRRCFEEEFIDGDFEQCYILLPINAK